MATKRTGSYCCCRWCWFCCSSAAATHVFIASPRVVELFATADGRGRHVASGGVRGTTWSRPAYYGTVVLHERCGARPRTYRSTIYTRARARPAVRRRRRLARVARAFRSIGPARCVCKLLLRVLRLQCADGACSCDTIRDIRGVRASAPHTGGPLSLSI